MPVREVNIPKPDKGLRALGIPTVTDRLIQQAISQKLSPIRRKLRVIVWKHWKKPRTKFRKINLYEPRGISVSKYRNDNFGNMEWLGR